MPRISALDRYVEMLREWQAKTNLVAHSTLPQLWTRHISDSLQLLALTPSAKVRVDFGSGGGFPGVVLAWISSLWRYNYRKVHFDNYKLQLSFQTPPPDYRPWRSGSSGAVSSVFGVPMWPSFVGPTDPVIDCKEVDSSAGGAALKCGSSPGCPIGLNCYSAVPGNDVVLLGTRDELSGLQSSALHFAIWRVCGPRA